MLWYFFCSKYYYSHLFRIFETQPWLTRNWRQMTQGRTPAAAISTIFSRIWLGKGRPFINTPPNWFTLPWPAKKGLSKFMFSKKTTKVWENLQVHWRYRFCQIFVTCLENMNFKSSWNILSLDFTNLLKLTTFFI